MSLMDLLSRLSLKETSSRLCLNVGLRGGGGDGGSIPGRYDLVDLKKSINGGVTGRYKSFCVKSMVQPDRSYG